jgi:hypothetical protein
MFCQEWIKLMDRCLAATKAYSEIMDEFRTEESLQGQKFDEAQQRAETAKETCRMADEALRKHEREHHCGVALQVSA